MRVEFLSWNTQYVENFQIGKNFSSFSFDSLSGKRHIENKISQKEFSSVPQIFIEHSDNVSVSHLTSLLPSLHTILFESLPATLSSCKSRILTHKNYLIADGDSKQAFIHVDVRILPGRDEALVDSIAKKILSTLESHFKGMYFGINLQISVGIDLLPLSYCKASV